MIVALGTNLETSRRGLTVQTVSMLKPFCEVASLNSYSLQRILVFT